MGGGGKRGLWQLPRLSRQVLSVSSWFRIPEQVSAVRGGVLCAWVRYHRHVEATFYSSAASRLTFSAIHHDVGHDGVRATEPWDGLLPARAGATTITITISSERRQQEQEPGDCDVLPRRGPASLAGAFPGAVAGVCQGRAHRVPPAAVAGAYISAEVRSIIGGSGW